MNNQKTAYVSFFSGIGGWDLGAYWAGARFDKHYFSEINPYAVKIFQQRFPDAVPLGDITKLEEKDFPKDAQYVFSGSFPCTDLSQAGKRDGIKGKQSGLWFDFLHLIGVCKPVVILIENVSALSIRGLDVVIAGLSSHGYSACWRVISAEDVGAPHLRKRIWIVSYLNEGLNYLNLPFNFKLKRRMCVETGKTVISLVDGKYLDKFYVGSVGGEDIIYDNACRPIGSRMPEGGFLTKDGHVYAVPAWEGGLEANEVLVHANDDFRGSLNERNYGDANSREDEEVRTSFPDISERAGTGHETVANAASSRRDGYFIPDIKTEGIRGSSLGCLPYSELEGAWDVKPRIQQMVDGVPWYVGSRHEVPFPVSFEKGVNFRQMLCCYGNALLPQIAWIVWRRVKPLISDCFL